MEKLNVSHRRRPILDPWASHPSEHCLSLTFVP